MVDWADKPAILDLMTDTPGHKQDAPSLLQSRERYYHLAETSPDPIVVYDLKGNFILVNNKTAHIYGVSSAEEFLGTVKNFTDLMDEENKARAIENIRTAMETGFSSSNEYTVYLRDRSTIKVDVNSSVVHGLDGKPQAIMSVVRDITDRKYAESLLAIQHDMAKCLSMARDLKTGMDQVLDIALKIEGIDCGGVYIMKQDSAEAFQPGSVELLAHAGVPQEFVDQVSSYSPSDPRAQLIARGQPLYSSHQELVSSLSLNNPAIVSLGLRAIAVVPVKFEGRVMGAILVASRSMDRTPLLARQVLEGVAAQIGAG